MFFSQLPIGAFQWPITSRSAFFVILESAKNTSYELILFLHPHEPYGHFFVFCTSLIRWNAGCSISMLFVDFQLSHSKAKLKSALKTSSNCVNIKTTSFRLQVCSLQLVNYYEHFATDYLHTSDI